MIEWVVSFLIDKPLGEAIIRMFKNRIFLIIVAILIVAIAVAFSGL
jgi:hypothetical protein